MTNLPAERADRSRGASGSSDADVVKDLAWQYRFIKAGTSSPLRGDLERCLDDLDRLIPLAWTTSDPAGMVLAMEMEDRRTQVIDALRFGREL